MKITYSHLLKSRHNDLNITVIVLFLFLSLGYPNYLKKAKAISISHLFHIKSFQSGDHAAAFMSTWSAAQRERERTKCSSTALVRPLNDWRHENASPSEAKYDCFHSSFNTTFNVPKIESKRVQLQTPHYRAITGDQFIC